MESKASAFGGLAKAKALDSKISEKFITIKSNSDILDASVLIWYYSNSGLIDN